jgi:hypothetical protein
MNAKAPKPIDASDFKPTDVARFWSKIDQAGGPSACWPWRGFRGREGYGQFQSRHNGRERKFIAHRVALALRRGSVKESVLHRCDNPPCCNPAHLWEGSQLENRRDCARKGRAAAGDRNGARLHPETRSRGEKNNMAKVTKEIVRQMRIEHERGVSGVEISRRFGLATSSVNAIVRRLTWKHVS